MSQLVVVIQCDIVTKRCSGYACMNTFANRVDTMADYPADTRFLMMTCGGCCGAGISAKLENLARKMKRYGDDKENVTIHFASCVVSALSLPELHGPNHRAQGLSLSLGDVYF